MCSVYIAMLVCQYTIYRARMRAHMYDAYDARGCDAFIQSLLRIKYNNKIIVVATYIHTHMRACPNLESVLLRQLYVTIML